MTEIPEHLRRRAAQARDEAENGAAPDLTLLGDGMTIEIQVAGEVVYRFANPDLSTPELRSRASSEFITAASKAIRSYNRDRMIAREIDLDSLAETINASPDDVAQALAAIRNTKNDDSPAFRRVDLRQDLETGTYPLDRGGSR